MGHRFANLFVVMSFFLCCVERRRLPGQHAFVSVTSNFLENNKSLDYKKTVEKLIQTYRNLRCNMSLKIHFLHSHLDFFPQNCGAVSDEHGERFHQDIAAMERRYQGKWSPSMLADYMYCWTLVRDSLPRIQEKSQEKQNRHKLKKK